MLENLDANSMLITKHSYWSRHSQLEKLLVFILIKLLYLQCFCLNAINPLNAFVECNISYRILILIPKGTPSISQYFGFHIGFIS